MNKAVPFMALVSCFAMGCSPPEAKVAPPPPATRVEKGPPPSVSATAEAPPGPPPSGAFREFLMTEPVWQTLSNGLRVATLKNASLPIVQIRVVVLGGASADGDKPGLASLTANLLSDGGAGSMSSGEFAERLESLGASLSVTTGFDRITLSTGVTKDQFGEALSLLSMAVAKPKMDAAEIKKLKKRVADDLSDKARTDGRWGAMMMLHKTMFDVGGAPGPYGRYEAMPSDVMKLGGADCREFHKNFFAAENMFVVVAGDVSEAEVKEATEKTLGAMPAKVGFSAALQTGAAPKGMQVVLLDRPKSTQSDVVVGVFGPARKAPEFAPWMVANQVLGGGTTGRLFLELREKAALAYRTQSTVAEFKNGPTLLTAYVGTQTNKTGLAVAALLREIESLEAAAPTAEEANLAARFLSDSMAIRLETVGALASELAKNVTLGLPDAEPRLLAQQFRAVTAEEVGRVAKANLRSSAKAVVVSGDAKVVGPMLRYFADVSVVDPMNGFRVTETLTKDENAKLEATEEAGK